MGLWGSEGQNRRWKRTRFLPATCHQRPSIMIFDLLTSNLDRFLPGWLMLDDQEKIIHWSEPARQTLGYAGSEILQHPFFELLPEYRVDKETFLGRLQQEGIESSVINHQIKLRHQTGVIVEVELCLYPLARNEEKYKLITLEKVTETAELQQYTNNKKLQLLDRFQFFQPAGASSHLSDIYDAVLVAVTSGQGLKFNRSFLFLIDQEENLLKGVQAIGPGSREEAGEIYAHFGETPRTLTEMISQYQKQKFHTDYWVNEKVKTIQINLANLDHILIQTLYHQRYRFITKDSPYYLLPSSAWLRETFHFNECLIMPLVWHGRSIGLLVVDNAITEHPITDLDIRNLVRFARVACNVIISVRLLSQLEANINAINETNLKLKESQAAMLQKEKLAAKGQLLSQMAHEVRGPLAIIGGYANRVFQKLEPQSPHYQHLNRIVETCKTLEQVLNGILDKDVAKSAEIAPYSDLAKVINRVLGLMEEEILRRRISVNLNLSGDLPLVTMTEHHLFEVVHNLIKNALEAMEHEGLLLIVASKMDKNISLTIQDTGSGISQAALERLFSPYFTTKRHGTGLGLVIVQKLVREYHGNLNYHSLEGKGTTFNITLPLYQEQAKSPGGIHEG